MQKILVLAVAALLLSACRGEDRSGEQPFAPTVRTLDAVVDGDRCTMAGAIEASPNSTVLARGFNYGNDTLRLEILSADSTDIFQAEADSLLPGEYFMVAFATNGVGTTRGDTLRFTVGEP